MRHVFLLLLVLATLQATAQIGKNPGTLKASQDSLAASLAAQNRQETVTCPAGQSARTDTATQSIMLRKQLNSMPVSNQLKLRPVDYKFLPSSSSPNMPEAQGQLRLRRSNEAANGYGSSLVEAGMSILQGILK